MAMCLLKSGLSQLGGNTYHLQLSRYEILLVVLAWELEIV